MIDREHVFGLRNEVGRDVRDITRKRGIIDGYVGQRESQLFLGKKPRRAERVERKGGGEREKERNMGRETEVGPKEWRKIEES